EPRTGGFTKSAAEIDIAGLVARRVGVRHVRCEHLEAARADGERLGMDAERGVDQLAHIRNIPEAGFGRSRASSVPCGRIAPSRSERGGLRRGSAEEKRRKRQRFSAERQELAALAAPPPPIAPGARAVLCSSLRAGSLALTPVPLRH